MNHEGLVDRINILLSQNRISEAKKLCETILERDPENEFYKLIFARIIFMEGNHDESREITEHLLTEDPENILALHLSLDIDLADKKIDKAESKAGRIIEMLPEDPSSHLAMVQVNMVKRNYDQALISINKSLELDAENVDALNYKIVIDRILGNQSQATIEEALELNTENPSTVANHGIQLLQEGKVKEALERLGYALSLDPSNTIARYGMQEALKSKFWLYRMFFKMKMMAARLSGRTLWIILLGSYLGLRILSKIAQSSPDYESILFPLVCAIGMIFMLTWILDPLMDLYLMTNKYGRHLLDKREKQSAYLVGSSLTFCVIFAALYLIFGKFQQLYLALTFYVAMIPFSSFLSPTDKDTRKILVVLMGTLFITGIISSIMNSKMFFVFPFGVFFYQFIINGILIKENARVFD